MELSTYTVAASCCRARGHGKKLLTTGYFLAAVRAQILPERVIAGCHFLHWYVSTCRFILLRVWSPIEIKPVHNSTWRLWHVSVGQCSWLSKHTDHGTAIADLLTRIKVLGHQEERQHITGITTGTKSRYWTSGTICG